MGCDLRLRIRYQRHLPTEVDECFDNKNSEYVSEWYRCPMSIPVSRSNRALMYELEKAVMSREEVLEQIRKWAQVLSTSLGELGDSIEDYAEAIGVLAKIYNEFADGQFIEVDYS
jgi:hypothetical protein